MPPIPDRLLSAPEALAQLSRIQVEQVIGEMRKWTRGELLQAAHAGSKRFTNRSIENTHIQSSAVAVGQSGQTARQSAMPFGSGATGSFFLDDDR